MQTMRNFKNLYTTMTTCSICGGLILSEALFPIAGKMCLCQTTTSASGTILNPYPKTSPPVAPTPSIEKELEEIRKRHLARENQITTVLNEYAAMGVMTHLPRTRVPSDVEKLLAIVEELQKENEELNKQLEQECSCRCHGEMILKVEMLKKDNEGLIKEAVKVGVMHNESMQTIDDLRSKIAEANDQRSCWESLYYGMFDTLKKERVERDREIAKLREQRDNFKTIAESACATVKEQEERIAGELHMARLGYEEDIVLGGNDSKYFKWLIQVLERTSLAPRSSLIKDGEAV